MEILVPGLDRRVFGVSLLEIRETRVRIVRGPAAEEEVMNAVQEASAPSPVAKSVSSDGKT